SDSFFSSKMSGFLSEPKPLTPRSWQPAPGTAPRSPGSTRRGTYDYGYEPTSAPRSWVPKALAPGGASNSPLSHSRAGPASEAVAAVLAAAAALPVPQMNSGLGPTASSSWQPSPDYSLPPSYAGSLHA
ncbi:unnamed protein product, partial [Polarella glacialis]